nr:MAG TPA: hypothetical protein [Caudoviricetes sp.]
MHQSTFNKENDFIQSLFVVFFVFKNSWHVCKRKTLLSLLNKQTSGLLFFMHLWQRQNSSVAYK